MRIVEQSVRCICGDNGLKHIEQCGRVCYQSQGRITEDSAQPFVEMLLSRGHTSVLEHAILHVPDRHLRWAKEENVPPFMRQRVKRLPFSGKWLINGRDLQKVTDPKSFLKILNLYQPIGMTVSIITDRGMSHELVRHRVFSFSQETTRVVKYDDLAVIAPDADEALWKPGVAAAETAYKTMIEMGYTPQIARAVLPTCAKTEIVMTGTEPQWLEFFRLRLDKAAHPQMRKLAAQIAEAIYGESWKVEIQKTGVEI